MVDRTDNPCGCQLERRPTNRRRAVGRGPRGRSATGTVAAGRQYTPHHRPTATSTRAKPKTGDYIGPAVQGQKQSKDKVHSLTERRLPPSSSGRARQTQRQSWEPYLRESLFSTCPAPREATKNSSSNDHHLITRGTAAHVWMKRILDHIGGEDGPRTRSPRSGPDGAATAA